NHCLLFHCSNSSGCCSSLSNLPIPTSIPKKFVTPRSKLAWKNAGFSSHLTPSCAARNFRYSCNCFATFITFHSSSPPRPLRCEFPDQPRDEVALAFLGRLEDLELLLREVPLDRFLHQRAQLVRLDGVKLDGDFAEVFRSRVAGLSRPCR